jgi:glucokinase
MSCAIGIDLGGTNIKGVAVRPDGTTLTQTQNSFAAEQRLVWADKIRSLIQQIQNEIAPKELPADSLDSPATPVVGVSAPGLASADGRSISHMPGRLHGLEGLDWTEFLGLGRRVPVLNDAHAALIGECWIGAARGFQNVILLTLGTGVGGAAMVDGRLLRGHLGRAGHLGHICLDHAGKPDIAGTPGSLEDAIGNCTIGVRTQGRFQTTHALVAAYRAGDSEAAAIWLKSVRDLACAIVSFINILDPEAVILGGGIARSGDALFGPLQGFVDEMEWRPGGQCARILPAQLGEYAGAYGAAHSARNDKLPNHND